MQAWITFWKYFCLIGIILFYILVVLIIPFGIRDLISMLRGLSCNKNDEEKNKPQIMF